MSELKRYTIEYGDGFGSEREVVGEWTTRAFDREHAIEKFRDSSDDDGFVPFRIAMTEGVARHLRNWFEVQS